MMGGKGKDTYMVMRYEAKLDLGGSNLGDTPGRWSEMGEGLG